MIALVIQLWYIARKTTTYFSAIDFERKAVIRRITWTSYYIIRCITYRQKNIYNKRIFPLVGYVCKFFPFPINPSLQVHSKLPIVFVHLAFMSQLCSPFSHSSSSIDNNKYNYSIWVLNCIATNLDKWIHSQNNHHDKSNYRQWYICSYLIN